MKRYITFVLVAMSLVGLVSCSNDNGIAAPNGEAQVALRFESSSMTRADVAGINDLNENLIKTIDCYFYPAEANEDTPAVWYQKFTFGTDGAGINSSASVTDILMPSGEMNAIFDTGTTGKIYAIANYAGGSALPTSGDGTSVSALKAKVVEAEWLKDGAFQKQSSFVMDSEMVDITKDGNTIKRNEAVPLTRTAAKVELTITGVEEAVSSTTTSADGTQTTTWYVPAILDTSNNPTGVNVTMNNARTIAGVGGIAQTYSKDSSLKLENYGFSTGNLYKQTNPFYTYPHTWESSEQEASLLLVVYWQATDKTSKDDEVFSTVGDAIPCYYEIPIGVADNKEISRNHIYQIGINVGTLGSFVKEDPMLLTPSYMVVDWGTGDISAKIKGQRYLVVDKKKIEIFNQTDCKVNYATSHTEGAMILSITRPNYTNQETEGIDVIYSYNTENNTSTGSLNGFALNCTDGVLSVSHVLDNDTNNYPYDYAPYTIIVRIYHTDEDDTFYEDVTFVQYPAMYITLEKNEGTNNKGYVYVYGYNADNTSYWYSVRGRATSGANSNPNMYTITVSALGANSQYIIGDPRVTTPITGSSIDLTKEDATNRDKTLDNYYPTRTDADAKNIIAPKFRIASSYGRCGNSITYDEAERRCAAYQEYGYPAGRWRVPTMAEVMYVAKLSSDGIFPHLFGSGNNYWAAQGGFTYTINGNTATVTERSDGNFVRCVYDEWYWGSEQLTNKTTFTWGDMPR